MNENYCSFLHYTVSARLLHAVIKLEILTLKSVVTIDSYIDTLYEYDMWDSMSLEACVQNGLARPHGLARRRCWHGTDRQNCTKW